MQRNKLLFLKNKNMLQVNRNNLKIPKRIKVVTKLANNIDDYIAIKKGIAMAESKKFNETKNEKPFKSYK